MSDALTRYVNSICSCGGSGPGDPNSCDACKLYHSTQAAIQEEKQKERLNHERTTNPLPLRHTANT